MRHRRDAEKDAEVFESLYPRLRRIAAVSAGSGVDPDDLVQEALARALRSRGSLVALDNPEAYLVRSILNLRNNAYRSMTRRVRAYSRLTPAAALEGDPVPSDLSALLQLSPLLRTTLFLSIVEDLSTAEIADLTGSTPGAVRAQLSRGLSALRAAYTTLDRTADASGEHERSR